MPQERYTLEDSLQLQTQDERLEIGNEANVEYQEALRLLNLGSRTGLPYEVIQANPDAVEKAVQQSDFNKKDWMRESPEFAKFAADNPLHLSVLKQDEENLTYFEREWKRPLNLSFNQTVAQVELNRLSARRRQGREYWQEGDEAKLDELRGQIQDHDFGAAEGWNPIISLTKQLGPMAYTVWTAKEEMMAAAVGGAIIGGKTGVVAGSVVPGAGNIVGLGAGATSGFFVGGGIGFTVGGAEGSFEMMSGEQYDRFIQAGFTHEEAATVSGITGAISTIPELAGVTRLLRHVPGVDKFMNWGSTQIAARIATDVLAKPTVRQATANLVGRFGVNMGVEIGTEVFQDSMATLGQNYLASEFDRPEAGVTYDQWKDDMADTIVHTARGMTILASLGPGSAYVGELRRAQRSRQAEDAFKALADNINKSETRRDAPETYAKFVEAVSEAKGGGVWTNANKWDEFWQGQNEDPNEMAKRFGMDLEVLETARTADHNVEIPALAFAEQLAPSKLFDDILPDLAWTEDSMSPRERKLFEANKPKIIRDIEASIEALKDAESSVDTENIMQDVAGQLVAAHYEPNTAKHLAQLYRGFGVIGEKLGMDPNELFDKFFGGVRRVTPEALRRSEVLDPSIDPILNRIRRDDRPTDKQMRGSSLMDFVDESGGLDPSDPELLARDFELGALDLGVSKAKMGRWKEGGRKVSEIAEIAAEAGYIPTNDESILLEALSREIGGEPVFGTRDGGQPGMREINEQMDMLERLIAQLGIDINDMTNEQVREVLEAADTFDQEATGAELRAMVQLLVDAQEKTGGLANDIDTILAKASTLMPLVYQEQDFGSLSFTDTVEVEGQDGTVEITEDAQVQFDDAVEDKLTLKRIAKCLSG